MAMKSKQVIVLGMHRSGTSLVAGILHKLGVNMGERMLGKSESNPCGHFEDLEFLYMNERILKMAGGYWNRPPSIESILKLQKMFDEKIKNRIERKMKQGIWGWKDPRMCVLMPLYQKHIPNGYYIYVNRNRNDIANSLFKRNNMPLHSSLHLTQIYNTRARQFLVNIPHEKWISIQYNELITKPNDCINTIIKFLDIQPSPNQIKNARQLVLPREELDKLIQHFKKST